MSEKETRGMEQTSAKVSSAEAKKKKAKYTMAKIIVILYVVVVIVILLTIAVIALVIYLVTFVKKAKAEGFALKKEVEKIWQNMYNVIILSQPGRERHCLRAIRPRPW